VTLLDPFAGLADLTSGVVRVLHDLSLIDDPTRILRGARFAARLGFVVEPQTTTLIQAALAAEMIRKTSAQRIWHELCLLLAEPRPEHALALLHRWDALPQLELLWSDGWRSQFPAARSAAWAELPLDLIGFGLLIWPLSRAQRLAFAARYNLPGDQRKLLQELPLSLPASLEQPELPALELERRLHAYSAVALRVLHLVASGSTAANILRYCTTIRPLPPLLSGDDLRTSGVAPGPIYREILHELRQAQLSGAVADRAAALIWLDQRLSRSR
jgi:tRNA nucleotidyltransferase (CCA-adding enzyme)